MQLARTRSLVEGGILSAMAIVFALISVYIPVLGMFVNLVWPVPIVLLGVRHGFRWSFLCLAVSGVVMAILISLVELCFDLRQFSSREPNKVDFQQNLLA